MRIGLDVMGGDHAPDAILDGAFLALESLDSDDELVLFGDEEIIRCRLAREGVDDPRIEVAPTTQSIAMDEAPVEAVRTKTKSSPMGSIATGWGGTYGALHDAVRQVQYDGHKVAHAHIRYLNPFPKNLETLLRSFKTILVPELNMGQLSLLLRGRFGMDNIVSFSKVQGRPFKITEVRDKIISLL